MNKKMRRSFTRPHCKRRGLIDKVETSRYHNALILPESSLSIIRTCITGSTDKQEVGTHLAASHLVVCFPQHHAKRCQSSILMPCVNNVHFKPNYETNRRPWTLTVREFYSHNERFAPQIRKQSLRKSPAMDSFPDFLLRKTMNRTFSLMKYGYFICATLSVMR